jgi:hypothetical protein
MFIQPRLEGEITRLFDAFYEETLDQRGRIAHD